MVAEPGSACRTTGWSGQRWLGVATRDMAGTRSPSGNPKGGEPSTPGTSSRMGVMGQAPGDGSRSSWMRSPSTRRLASDRRGDPSGSGGIQGVSKRLEDCRRAPVPSLGDDRGRDHSRC
jgi:hypothetical protein